MIADMMLAAHAQIEDRPAEEQAERLAVVQEAMTWLGTPWHHMGRVKGAGVDCGMFLAEVFHQAGLVEPVEVEPYPSDWHLHRGDERFQQIVESYAHPAEGPALPGDIVLFKFGRCLSHGAIVIAWPLVLHSYLDNGVPSGVIFENLEEDGPLRKRLAGTWSVWGGER